MKPKIILFASFLFCLFGCATSKITDSWSIGPDQERFQQVVVLALLPDEKLKLREALEAHMADDLCQLDYYTLSALDAYGKDGFCNMCEAEILEKLKRDQIDAVVTIALVDQKRQVEFIGEKFKDNLIGNGLFEYQREMSSQVRDSGYYAVRHFYYWQTNVYRLRDQKLVYSSRTEVLEMNSAETFAHEYGRLILRDMVEKKIFEGLPKNNIFF
ncbi:MAG: hypothetical protein EOO51_08950 [Flavobacterium sp.]|nr:MAG: hypothetical protein EOO51_08950 [Flavobacterium sp.]